MEFPQKSACTLVLVVSSKNIIVDITIVTGRYNIYSFSHPFRLTLADILDTPAPRSSKITTKFLLLFVVFVVIRVQVGSAACIAIPVCPVPRLKIHVEVLPVFRRWEC